MRETVNSGLGDDPTQRSRRGKYCRIETPCRFPSGSVDREEEVFPGRHRLHRPLVARVLESCRIQRWHKRSGAREQCDIAPQSIRDRDHAVELHCVLSSFECLNGGTTHPGEQRQLGLGHAQLKATRDERFGQFSRVLTGSSSRFRHHRSLCLPWHAYWNFPEGSADNEPLCLLQQAESVETSSRRRARCACVGKRTDCPRYANVLRNGRRRPGTVGVGPKSTRVQQLVRHSGLHCPMRSKAVIL
ncbi:hypothetical protein SRABI91_02688 [Rhodococcoides fascians]|nr:hypothetical protein SRABI91_02688 [Rhodococcus fascians]